MQIKSFRAQTISQALDLVKKELGPDAIILGNRKVSISPTQSLVEVTAALEPEPPTRVVDNGTVKDEIKDEIKEIKSFLSLLISSKDYFAQLQIREPLSEVYHSLLIRGLDEKHTYVALKKALGELDDASPDRQEIIEAFSRQLLDSVNFSRPFQNISQTGRPPSVFTFLGPTGVGKTTTLAKLAAYLKIKRQQKVGIVSIDTYRIGAVEQLQTYTNILDTPLIVAQSKDEFLQAREELQHQDAILVDTIGKNFLRSSHVQNLMDVFAGCTNVDHFLVLSATAKDQDLRQTIIHFRPMNIHSLIFTKVDETLSHGCMLNQLLRFPYPLSYLGTGQRVPEDIELATQKRLLSFLFPPGNGSFGKE